MVIRSKVGCSKAQYEKKYKRERERERERGALPQKQRRIVQKQRKSP
jgi:hypothetical protein